MTAPAVPVGPGPSPEIRVQSRQHLGEDLEVAFPFRLPCHAALLQEHRLREEGAGTGSALGYLGLTPGTQRPGGLDGRLTLAHPLRVHLGSKLCWTLSYPNSSAPRLANSESTSGLH